MKNTLFVHFPKIRNLCIRRAELHLDYGLISNIRRHFLGTLRHSGSHKVRDLAGLLGEEPHVHVLSDTECLYEERFFFARYMRITTNFLPRTRHDQWFFYICIFHTIYSTRSGMIFGFHITQNIAERCQEYFQYFIAIELLSQIFC